MCVQGLQEVDGVTGELTVVQVGQQGVHALLEGVSRVHVK